MEREREGKREGDRGREWEVERGREGDRKWEMRRERERRTMFEMFERPLVAEGIPQLYLRCDSWSRIE